MVFYAYMLLCSDGSYYAGHTDNLELRFGQHNQGTIPGYTKSRRPVRLVWSQEFGERYEALAAERRIKGWSKAKKEALIDRRWDELSRLSKSRSQFVLRQAQDEREEVVGYIAKSVVTSTLTAARTAHPREACGILLGEGGRITAFLETANVHPEPETHFEIDPQALIDAHRQARGGGAQVVGYFHSHPNGPARPSATDAAMAASDGMVWAISGDTWGDMESDTCGEKGDTLSAQGDTFAGKCITFWRDDAGGFTRLSYLAATR